MNRSLLEKAQCFQGLVKIPLSGNRLSGAQFLAKNGASEPVSAPQHSLTLNYLISGIHVLFTFVLKCSP